MSTNLKRRTLAAAALVLVAGSGVACDTQEPSGSSQPETPGAAAGYPVTVTNCGQPQTFDEAPTRVVAGLPTQLETLLALGVTDHVIGYLAGDSAPLPDGVTGIEEISPQWRAAREVVLAAQPDLVLLDSASQASGEGGTVTLDDLHTAGAKTFIFQDNCADGGDPPTIDQVYIDLEQLGAIFGVPERAADLVAGLQARVVAVNDLRGDREPATVAFVQVFDGTLYALGGSNYDAVLTAAGTVNEFADLPTAFAEISAEEVLVMEPDHVVVAFDQPDSPDQALDRVRELLSANPAVAAGNLTAVSSDQLGAGGVSLVDVVEQIGTAVYG